MNDPASTPAAAPSDPIDLALAKLQAQYPNSEVELYTSTMAGALILRTPDEADLTKFYAGRSDDGRTVQNTNAFCLACTLYPTAPELVALFKRKPAISQRIGQRLLEKAGAMEEIRLGK